MHLQNVGKNVVKVIKYLVNSILYHTFFDSADKRSWCIGLHVVVLSEQCALLHAYIQGVVHK